MKGRKGQVITSCDISSLVVDSLCDYAAGENVVVVCFYFDRGAQKEQWPTSVLGAILKQNVGGLDEVPGEIDPVYGIGKGSLVDMDTAHSHAMRRL